MLNRVFATLLVAAVVFAGCSQPAEDPADTPETEPTEEGSATVDREAIEENAAEEVTEEAPAAESPAEEAVAEEASAEEAESESIALPAAIADLVVMSDEFTVTKVDTLNEEKLQYVIEAGTKLNVDKVQAYFVNMYEDKGWMKDMNMSQKGNTVTSYKSPDGFLVFIEANKGGRGSEVAINTGKV